MIIKKIETFCDGENIKGIGFVKITTEDGKFGWGQMSPYNADISSLVLHRQVAPFCVGKEIPEIKFVEDFVNLIFEKQHKFPGSYMCRAMGGVDTAILDYWGRWLEKPVCSLFGAEPKKIMVYGSSMKRDITPKDEVLRFKRLRDSCGFKAFKYRVGSEVGRDKDEWDGRTEEIIDLMGNSFSGVVKLLADGNSCFSEKKAIAVGNRLFDNGTCHFEEPCPYWEHDVIKAVKESLEIDIAGGEQDNNITIWNYLIRNGVVDIVQPDILYIGGFLRARRVAKMAKENGLPCTPHAANLSLVTIFTQHFLACIDNPGPYLEYSIEGEDYYPWQFGVFKNFPKVYDGFLEINPEPGWGIEINEKWLAHSIYQISQ